MACCKFFLSLLFFFTTVEPCAFGDDKGPTDAESAQQQSKRQLLLTIARCEKEIASGGGYAPLWQGARAIVRLLDGPMAYAPGSQRGALYEKGIPWAEEAVEKNPKGAEGHYYLAVLLGLKAQASMTASIFVARSIREHAQRALELNPGVACAGPHRVLGRYYHKLPGLLGGDDALSKKLLAESVRRCPANAMGRLFLAETLHALGEYEEAERQCRWILSHHPSKAPTPKQKQAASGAKALLKEMEIAF